MNPWAASSSWPPLGLIHPVRLSVARKWRSAQIVVNGTRTLSSPGRRGGRSAPGGASPLSNIQTASYMGQQACSQTTARVVRDKPRPLPGGLENHPSRGTTLHPRSRRCGRPGNRVRIQEYGGKRWVIPVTQVSDCSGNERKRF